MAGTRKFMFNVALVLLWGILAEAAPRPEPVEVFGGYSSVSKSVTFTKRLEFQMNKDQSLKAPSTEDKSAINSIKTNDTTKEVKKTPLVNHSVQFSIGTNIKSDEAGKMDPPSVMETIANDINEMKKMAKNGIKTAEAIASSTSSPSIDPQSNTERVELSLSLENYDDALYEDVAPEDSGSLDNRDKIPVIQISQKEASLLEDHKIDVIDSQSNSSISRINTEKDVAPDSAVELELNQENEFVTTTSPEDITSVSMEDSTIKGTENYDELIVSQEGISGMVKADDRLAESIPPPALGELDLTETFDDNKPLITQPPPPASGETEALPLMEDDTQFTGRLIRTKNIVDQLLHQDEFKLKISDSLDKKDGNGQSTNIEHFPSAVRTLSDLRNDTVVKDQLSGDQFENSSDVFHDVTEEYDGTIEHNHSTAAPIESDKGKDFETTVSEISVTESLLSDTMDEINTEAQIDAAFHAQEEKMPGSATDVPFEEPQRNVNEMKTSTPTTEDSANAGIVATTISSPTQPEELYEDSDALTTPVSSQVTSNEDKDLEFMFPIGVLVNDSGLEDFPNHNQPPAGNPLTTSGVGEAREENEYNYASFYPTDYEYVDFEETTDRATTTADVLSTYEYTDTVDTSFPGTSSDFVTDEIAHASRFDYDIIHEQKFLTSTIPTDLLKTENVLPNETSNHQNERTTHSPHEWQNLEAIKSTTENTLKEAMGEDEGQNQDFNYDYANFESFDIAHSDGGTENDSLLPSVPTTERESIYHTDLPLGASIEIGDFGSDPIADTAFIASKSAKPKIFPTKNEDHGQFVADHQPSIDIPALISNIDFSKIDLSGLDFSGLEGALAQTGENSGTASPLNLASSDLSRLISDLGLGDVDISHVPSDFDVRNIDISSINLENIPPFELGSNLGLFQLPNSSQNKAVQPNPNLANLHAGLNFAEVISPYAHSLRKFNSASPHTRIPDLYDHSVDPSHVNLNIDHVSKFPVGFPHPLVPNAQHGRAPQLQPFSISPYLGLHDTGDQFLFVENVGGRNFDASSVVNLQRPGKITDLNEPAESFNFATAQPYPTNADQLSDKQSSGGIEFRTRPIYPEPNTSNFFHPLDIVDPNSFHNADNAKNRQMPSGKNVENLYEDYFDEGAFGVKISAENQTKDTTDDSNTSNLTELTPLLKGPDLSDFDLTQIPANLNLSGIDLSIPTNFSIEGLDIDKIVSSIDLSKLDLSKINFAELDIPKILKQLSSSSLDTTLLGQSSLSHEAETNLQDELAMSSESTINEKSLPAPGPVTVDGVERSKWITENETDQKVLDELGISHFLSMASSISLDGGASSNFLLCTMCKTGVVTGRKLMTDLAKSDREILSLVVYMCIEFKMFPKDVCRGMINSVGYEVLHVLRTTPHNPEIFCSMLLAGTCEEMPLPSWSIDIPERKTTLRTEPSVHPSHGDFLILHISDLHTDPEYTAGTDAECDYPLCCRDWDAREGRGYRRDGDTPKRPMESFAASVMANADDPNTDLPIKPPSTTKFPKHAGRWGAFGRCDLPLRSVDRILQAGADLRPDLVSGVAGGSDVTENSYITGDLPPHDVWVQTKESVQQVNALTAERIRLAFPDTPLVMTVGNHETDPINSVPVPEVYDQGFNPTWLYESLAAQWKQWVPSSSLPTLIKGGYYSVTPYPGLRVLSINSNYCNSMNWWLMIAHKDPTEQLKWMDQQLAEADAAGEKVHILTHIPPGYHECLPSWSKEFASIVTKYADVVTGIFSGHQHLDQWEVIYDPEDSTKPMSVVYVAPSATTFREHSPSFRTFTVDGGNGNESSWVVVDHHTYTANLTIANLPDNILEFEHRYSARKEFNMTDLSPQSWSDVVNVMASNQTMFNKHMRFKHNYWSEPTEINDCDRECKEKSLCFLVTGDSSNKEPCQRLKKIIT